MKVLCFGLIEYHLNISSLNKDNYLIEIFLAVSLAKNTIFACYLMYCFVFIQLFKVQKL
jgi:hypothetical protein